MKVRDIRTSYLLTPIWAVYSIIQHNVLPRSGKIDVMTKVDQMVMFYLMTKRRINLIRLILDFIISTIGVKRRRHATLPYGMFSPECSLRHNYHRMDKDLTIKDLPL